MEITTTSSTTTGTLDDIRRLLSNRFDTGIVVEETGDGVWEWAAKRGSHWGRIVRDEDHHFTRPASNVLGFALRTKKAFIIEVSSYG